MKKLFGLILALILCFSLVGSAFAEDFVPSIGAKPAPELVPIEDNDGKTAIAVIKDKNGNPVCYSYDGCLLITPIAEAETSTSIPDDARELLMDVYEQLVAGTMTIPTTLINPDITEGYMVIRDLFDVTYLCDECPEELEKEGVVLELVFDVGVKADEEIYTFMYKNEEWTLLPTTNNGDGTLTVVTEHLCPIALAVYTGPELPPVEEGFNWLYVLIAAGVLLIIVLIIIFSKRDKKKKD